MILLIDNYDSFVYNLSRYVTNLGFETHVYRNNEINLADIHRLNPSHIILSPGPCTPNEAGISLDLIKEFHKTVPILGVCLGHQAIGQAFGATIERANFPKHGKSSQIKHNNTTIFKGLDNPLKVARYHSLIIEKNTVPDCLSVLAMSLDDNEIMAVAHRDYPTLGVQFHPESILTTQGYQLVSNFIFSDERTVTHDEMDFEHEAQ